MAQLQRWDPFSDLTTLHGQLDDVFNNLFQSSGLPASTSITGAPAINLYTDDDKELVVEVEAPGYAKDDVEVSIHEGILEIKGQKNEKEEQGKAGKRNYMLRESHSSFYRRVALPRRADADKIKADFESGMLRVTVPFKELPKPTKVEIQSGKTGK